MKKATENFDEMLKRLGESTFNEFYGDNDPRTFEIVDESEDEICILQKFEFYNEGSKMLRIWQPKNRFYITKN